MVSFPHSQGLFEVSKRALLAVTRGGVASNVTVTADWQFCPCREPVWNVVEFTSFPRRDQVLLGPGHSFAIPVLMNRTVPRPKVTLAKVLKE